MRTPLCLSPPSPPTAISALHVTPSVRINKLRKTVISIEIV